MIVWTKRAECFLSAVRSKVKVEGYMPLSSTEDGGSLPTLEAHTRSNKLGALPQTWHRPPPANSPLQKACFGWLAIFILRYSLHSVAAAAHSPSASGRANE